MIPYFLGAILIVAASFIISPPVSFILLFLLFISYTSWYKLFLINKYILSLPDGNIRGAPLSIFKRPVQLVLFINSVIAVILITFGFLNKTWIVPAIGWFGISVIMYVVLQYYIRAKFISEIFMKNPTLHNSDLTNFYKDLRSLLVQKLIK